MPLLWSWQRVGVARCGLPPPLLGGRCCRASGERSCHCRCSCPAAAAGLPSSPAGQPRHKPRSFTTSAASNARTARPPLAPLPSQRDRKPRLRVSASAPAPSPQSSTCCGFVDGLGPQPPKPRRRRPHVLGLADGDARHAGHGLHAQLLHGLAALLLRTALLALGAALLVCEVRTEGVKRDVSACSGRRARAAPRHQRHGRLAALQRRRRCLALACAPSISGMSPSESLETSSSTSTSSTTSWGRGGRRPARAGAAGAAR
jgi:hypothetical protein